MLTSDEPLRTPNTDRAGQRNWTNRLFTGAISAIYHLKSCTCVVACSMACTCGGTDAFLVECAALRSIDEEAA